MSEIAKHWIDGEWTGSETVSESVNPATGEVLGRGPEGTSPSLTLRHNAAQALTGTGSSAEVAPGQWFSTYAEPAGIIVPWNSPVGPVATFEVFDTETDAITRANATEFGLAAGLFTSSINTSRRVSREIHAGTVWTNTWAAINDGFAEGGYKQSGVGRLRGPLAITEFTEAKTVHAIPPLQG
jgi:acyl-CoA reductase-like NAD-dependent aldehyde dehydrogenase